MEPLEVNYYCQNPKDGKNKNCKCIGINLFILVTLFFATIGLILGAVFSTALLASLPVLILAAVILALLTVLSIIYKACICNKKKCC